MDIHDEINDIRRRAGLQEQTRPSSYEITLRNLLKQQQIFVERAIVVPTPNHIDYQNLGVYWAHEEGAGHAMGWDEADSGWYIWIEGQVTRGAVNWKTTFAELNSAEVELVLYPNKPVNIKSVRGRKMLPREEYGPVVEINHPISGNT